MQPDRNSGRVLLLREGMVMVVALTAKQQRFCDEYLIDLNATQAAIRAGYSEKTARIIAAENLTKPNIKAYIQQRMDEKEKELIADQNEVLKYLTAVMRGDHTEQTPIFIGEGIQKITDIDVSAKDRLKAAELLGKRYSLFTDKMKLDVALPVVISGDDELEDG